jgi:hypothetical protein
VATGDYLIAFVAVYLPAGAEQVTITPPAGWVTLSTVFVDGAQPHQMNVMVRTVQSGDPTGWFASLNVFTSLQTTVTVAYRGATGVVSSNFRDAQQATTLITGSVTTSSIYSWIVAAGSYEAANASWSLEAATSDGKHVDERIARSVTATLSTGEPIAIEITAFDSGTPPGAGTHQYTVFRGAAWEAAAAWIGVLNASDTSTSGTVSMSMPRPSVNFDCVFGTQGPLSATLPFPTMEDWTGVASPPEGPLSALVVPDMSLEGTQAVFGTMTCLITPVVASVGETRLFGSRVVIIEAEDRTVIARLGADTDDTD